MVIRETEATNNCEAGRKFGVSEVNICKWRQIKEKLRKANSFRKSFSGPKRGEISWNKKLLNKCKRKVMRVCRSLEKR